MNSGVVPAPLATKQLLDILQSFANRFKQEVPQHLAVFGRAGRLRGACEYALLSGKPKRFRAALTYMVAEALGHGLDVSAAAAAVECFHSSSLIVDDMPCMDNDDYRRGVPTCHRAFDESTALLASYGMYAAGFELIMQNVKSFSQSGSPLSSQWGIICTLAIQKTSESMGNKGIISGQYNDLTLLKPSEEGLLQLYRDKTGALIDLSLSLGWLFGGGNTDQFSLMRELAIPICYLFQLMDDLEDAHHNSVKDHMNGVVILGIDRCRELIEGHSAGAEEAYNRTGLDCKPLLSLIRALSEICRELATQY